MAPQTHRETGEQGSDDVRAYTRPDGVTLELLGGDDEAWSDLSPAAALRLGEWLIVQAISQGARPD